MDRKQFNYPLLRRVLELYPGGEAIAIVERITSSVSDARIWESCVSDEELHSLIIDVMGRDFPSSSSSRDPRFQASSSSDGIRHPFAPIGPIGYLPTSQFQQVPSQQPPPQGCYFPSSSSSWNPQPQASSSSHGLRAPFARHEFGNQELAVDPRVALVMDQQIRFLAECSQQPPPAIRDFSYPYWNGQHQSRRNPSFHGFHAPSAGQTGDFRSSLPGSMVYQQRPLRIPGNGGKTKKSRLCEYFFCRGSCLKGANCKYSHEYSVSDTLNRWRDAGSSGAHMIFLRFLRANSITPNQAQTYFSKYGVVSRVYIPRYARHGYVSFEDRRAAKSLLCVFLSSPPMEILNPAEEAMSDDQ